MSYGLSEDIIKKITSVFESEQKISSVILFGSRAKGNFKPGSDIDFAVKGKDYNYDNNLSVLTQLDQLDLPYKIDLIIYSSIQEIALINHIDRVGIVFYKR